MYIIGNTQYPCKSYSELRICSDFCLKCTSVQTWYGPSIQTHNKVTMLLPWLMRPVLIAYTCSQEGSDLNKISFLYLYTKLYLKQKRQKHRDFFLIDVQIWSICKRVHKGILTHCNLHRKRLNSI